VLEKTQYKNPVLNMIHLDRFQILQKLKNSRPCPKELNYLQEKNYCGIEPEAKGFGTHLVLDFDFQINSDVSVNPNQVKEAFYYFDLRRSTKVSSIFIVYTDFIYQVR
ncbi:uncharacterized protein LOC132760249, partial [Ruditapes philippinarum]|uniref:uncharacterized protein LOC132760249 n=1 Tax=Ruditapes philippinarum TaxID=129788 RepID=UPI00295C083A